MNTNDLFRRFLSGLVISFLLAGVLACNAPPTTVGQSTVQPTKQAAPAKTTLTIGMNIDPDFLDPMQTTTAGAEAVIDAAVEKLAVWEANSPKVIPWLLESWEFKDATTIQLNLRKGISFSNGEPFNAAAVKFSYEAWMAQPVMTQVTTRYKGIQFEIVNDSTIILRLAKVVPTFLTDMGRYAYMVPPKYYAEVGPVGFNKAPIGTGPFIFVRRDPASQVVFKKNPNYWRGPRPFESVIFRIIPEEVARTAALETGEIDIAYYLPEAMAKRLQTVPGVVVKSNPGQRKFAVFYNADMPGGEPLLDNRVRLAMNYAVDIDTMIAKQYSGLATKLPGQFSYPGEFGLNPKVAAYPYDPAKAKQLLSEAGYPNGFKITFAYPTGRYPKDKENGEILSSYFQAVGIQVEQKPLEWGEFSSQRTKRTLGQLFYFGILVAPDMEYTFSYMAYGKEARGAPLFTWSKEWWALYDKSTGEADMAKREALYFQMQQIDHDTPYAIPLFAPMDFYAWRDYVKGFVPRNDQFLFLHDVTFG
jgi:peptide/nickel transport system substrate-binding protein